MVRIFLAVSIMISFVLAGSTFAYGDGDKEQWNPVSAGPLTTWTAPLCGKGKFVIQPFLFYNYTRGAFNSEGHYDSLPKGDKKSQFQQQIFMQYGLADRVEIDAQILYQENLRRQDGNNAHSDGFGDSYLFLRYCAIEENDKLPHVTGLFQLKIPTGKYQKLDSNKLGTDSMGATSGGGSYDHGYGINLTKRLKSFIIHADAIYSFPLKRKINDVKTRYGRYLNYDFGVEYFLPEGFNLMIEFNGFLQGDKIQDGEKIPASDINYLAAAPGIGWSNERIQTLLVYQRTVAGTNTDANDSVVLTFVYAF